MKCADCPDYKACRRQNDLRRKRHKCKKANEPFVQTNADRIRAMSDEELARLMADKCLDGEIEKLTKIGLTPTYSEKEIVRHKLFMQWFDWLRQPVKDGDNDG